MLRAPIDRIGLGSYLHLVEEAPDFVEYIAQISDEFRSIKALHAQGSPCILRPRVAVLHYWDSLRSWTLSGHFHKTYMHDLIHINESLSGLPFDVRFYDSFFRMAHVLGIDEDTGDRVCHGRWTFDVSAPDRLISARWNHMEYL